MEIFAKWSSKYPFCFSSKGVYTNINIFLKAPSRDSQGQVDRDESV